MPDNTLWRERHHLLDKEHTADVEARAAIHELSGGMSRRDAEDRAYAEYITDHMKRSAAHHLAGMKAAHAAGDKHSSMQHGLVYGAVMQALGHSPHAEPPDEISAMSRDPLLTPVYQFRPHSADALVLELLRQKQGGKKLGKGEDTSTQYVGRYIDAFEDTTMWDMSHHLSKARQDAGERLHLRETPAGRVVDHIRFEDDRRIQLNMFVEGAESEGELAKSAQQAMQARKAVEMAEIAVRVRRLQKLLESAD